jgi:hypothetical protein
VLERRVRVGLGHGGGVGLGGGAGRDADVAAGLDDPVEGAAVHDQVADHGEGGRPPGFHVDGVAVPEGAHVQLAGGGALGAVGVAVDDEAARPADALAAVVVEGHGVLAAQEEVLVEGVEHFEEGHVPGDAVDLVGDHGARFGGVLLAPDAQVEPHA